jgi:hypothetical protein
MSDRLRNLRNRPFLVVNTLFRPATVGNKLGGNTRTHKKGWMEETGNTAMFERAWIVDRVSSKTMREATVIIDIMQSGAIKNRYDTFDENAISDEQVVEHYLGKYMDKCKEGLDLWLSRQAATFAKSKEYLEIKDEVEARKAAAEAEKANASKIVKTEVTEDLLTDVTALGIDVKKELQQTVRTVEGDPNADVEITVHKNDGTQAIL